MKNILRSIGVVLALTVASTAFCQDIAAVKQRMAQRLPQLDAARASGAVGENNRGFAEVRGGGGDAHQLVAAENADRTEVYTAVSKKTGSTPEAVGQARAKKIAENAAPGVWLQRESGEWYRK